jgi:hypothetical protein
MKTIVSFRPIQQTHEVDFYDAEESGPRTGISQIVFNVTLTQACPPLQTTPLRNFLATPGTQLPRSDEYETALNIVLLRFAGQSRELTTAARGTKIFSLQNDDTRKDLGFALWTYRRYQRRIHVLQGGLFLRLNTTASIMIEENRVDLVIGKWRPLIPLTTWLTRSRCLNNS